MIENEILIPISKMNNNIWFDDIRAIDELENFFKEQMIMNSMLGVTLNYGVVTDILTNAKLSVYQKHYCNECKHNKKDLKWHKEHNTELEWSYSIEECSYVFRCNNMERRY